MCASALNPSAAMSLAAITYDDEGGTLAEQKVQMSTDLSKLPASAEGPWSLVYSQTNLGGVGTTDSFSGPPISNLSYTAEAEAQHDHNVYLQHVTPAAKRA